MWTWGATRIVPVFECSVLRIGARAHSRGWWYSATAGSIIERNAKCKRLNGHNGNECCACVSAIITYMPIISYLVLFNLRLFDNRFNGIHVICLTCTCALCTRRKHFGIEAGLVWNLSRWYEMHRRHFAGGMFHITWREKWFENMPRSGPPRRIRKYLRDRWHGHGQRHSSIYFHVALWIRRWIVHKHTQKKMHFLTEKKIINQCACKLRQIV